jgi:predicted aldo/keto reductase-like oxidoreductase
VNIPRIFDLYNEAIIYNSAAENRKSYDSMRPAERADKCNTCNECLALCANKVNIPASLEKAHEFLTVKA